MTELLKSAAAISELGVLGLLCLALMGFIVGGWKRVYVWGWLLVEAENRRKEEGARYEILLTMAKNREDDWRQIALSGGRIAESAVDMAKRK